MKIKNANMPAMPCNIKESTGLKAPQDYIHKSFRGLTKREHFAGLAMQAMLNNSSLENFMSANQEIAKQAMENISILKGAGYASITQGPAAYVVSQPVIDYSSPSIFIPLGVSILAGIYTCMLISDWIRSKK